MASRMVSTLYYALYSFVHSYSQKIDPSTHETLWFLQPLGDHTLLIRSTTDEIKIWTARHTFMIENEFSCAPV